MAATAPPRPGCPARASPPPRGILARRRSEFEKEGAHALKISKPNGTFTPEDVSEFRRPGWGVHGAGTAPAKVGASLAAKDRVELNPKNAMVRILGPELRARAVIITSPEPLTEDLTFLEVRQMPWRWSTKNRDWPNVSRHTILGRWHQIKKQIYAEYLEECALPF